MKDELIQYTKISIFVTGFIILLLSQNSINATTIQLSNTSAEYLINIYDASGEFKGSANTTNFVNITKSDFIIELIYPQKDFISKPGDIFGVFSVFIFIVVILFIIVFIGLALTGGFSKFIK